ncbi:MAG: acyltransferase [Phycisphaerales bacterium]|nr:acyltransferase [Hyphomonadaceae bacterium]
MVTTDIAGKERFAVLDGMRGLAALAVITDHVPSALMTSLLPGRYLAVDFFFVLSGFVLAHVYGERLRTGMSFSAFMRVRAVRLWPLYLAGTLIGAALALLYVIRGWNEASPLQVGTSLLFALFLLPCPPSLSIWPNAPYPLNGPAWSLFFEMFVNAIFALVARWLSPVLCLGVMAVSGILLVLSAFSFGQLDGGFAWSNFIVGFPRVTFGFFTGVWLYLVRAHERVPALPTWAAYIALAAVFMIPGEGLVRSFVDLIAALILFPALVAFCANSRAKGAVLWLSTLIGALSYGVYILHVPLWGWLNLVLERLGIVLPGIVNVLLAAAAALAIAALLDKVYDRPLRRRLSRKPSPLIAPRED